MLMMIVQLLVFTCAYALGAADEQPSYRDIDGSLREAALLLKEHVLSLEANIPGPNDPRRQYIDIIYVVHAVAQAQILDRQDYYKDYQKNVNTSLAFAVVSPESVIKLTKERLNAIIDIIKPIQEVIQSVLNSVGDVYGLADNSWIDKAVDDKINTNGGKYDYARRVYLAAGLFATELIKYDRLYFAPNSNHLSAHNLIITGAEKLNTIVMALKNLYDIAFPY